MPRPSDDPHLRVPAGLGDAHSGDRLRRNIEAGASRLHPFADALGLRDPAPDDGAQLLIADSPLLTPAEQGRSLLALHVGIDVASGRAARARLDAVGRIATTALTTVVHRAPAGERLWFEARLEHAGERDGRGYRQITCGVRVRDRAGQVAHGTMVALALTGAPDGEIPPPMPPPREEGLRDLERLLATGADSLTRALLLDGGALAPAEQGELTVSVRPLLGNLFGHLQGGAAPAIADLLARDLIGRPELRPCTSHWTFRGPVERSGRFEVAVATGASSAHATIRLSEDGRLRGAGVIDYRPGAGADGTAPGAG